MFKLLTKLVTSAKQTLKKTFSKQKLQREARTKKKQMRKTNLNREIHKKKQQLHPSNIRREVRENFGSIKNVRNTTPQEITINNFNDDITSRTFREDKRLEKMQDKFFKANKAQASAFYSLTKPIWDDGITPPEQRNNKIVDFMINHNLAYTDENGKQIYVSNTRDAFNLIKQLYPNELNEAYNIDQTVGELKGHSEFESTSESELYKQARGEVQISPIVGSSIIDQLIERFAA